MAVVEADDVVGNAVHGFALVSVIVLPIALHLQIQEEALHYRVVPAVALAAHAADQAMVAQQFLVRRVSVLAAAVRMQSTLRPVGAAH